MNCKKAKELFSGYLEDWLSNEERRELGVHIDKCEKCVETFNEFRKSVSILQSLPRVPKPDFFVEKVTEIALKEEIREERTVLYPRYSLRLAGAFVSIVLALFLLLRSTDILKQSKEFTSLTQEETSVTIRTPSYPPASAVSPFPQEAEFVLDGWVLSEEGARPESYLPSDGGGETFVTF